MSKEQASVKKPKYALIVRSVDGSREIVKMTDEQAFPRISVGDLIFTAADDQITIEGERRVVAVQHSIFRQEGSQVGPVVGHVVVLDTEAIDDIAHDWDAGAEREASKAPGIFDPPH